MNEWKIDYVYNGNRTDYVMADSLPLALERWRNEHPGVPSITLYAITCIK